MNRRYILFPGLMTLPLMACGWLTPPPSPLQAQTQPVAGAQTYTLSDHLLRGITAQDTVTLNGRTVLGTTSLHANTGYVLNGQVSISGTLSAATPATLPAGARITCVDNARLGSCPDGKPKTTLPAINIPIPQLKPLLNVYQVNTYSKTHPGNLALNSKEQLQTFLPDGATLQVQGNLIFNTSVTMKDAVVKVQGDLTSNAPITLINSTIIARNISLNQASVQNSRFIAENQFTSNTSLSATGHSTLFAGTALTLNGLLQASGQLAVQSTGPLRLNSGSQGTAQVVLWSGKQLEVNGNTTIQGGILSANTVRINGNFELKKATAISNPDFEPRPLINTTPATSTGPVKPGGTFTGVDGVSVSLPVQGVVDQNGDPINELQVTIERVDPATLNLSGHLKPLISLYRITANKHVFQPEEGFKITIPTNLARDKRTMVLSLLQAEHDIDQAGKEITLSDYQVIAPYDDFRFYQPGKSITTHVPNLFSVKGDVIYLKDGPNPLLITPDGQDRTQVNPGQVSRQAVASYEVECWASQSYCAKPEYQQMMQALTIEVNKAANELAEAVGRSPQDLNLKNKVVMALRQAENE